MSHGCRLIWITTHAIGLRHPSNVELHCLEFRERRRQYVCVEFRVREQDCEGQSRDDVDWCTSYCSGRTTWSTLLSFQHPSSKTLAVPDDVRRIFRLRRRSHGIHNTFWCVCRTIVVRRVDRYFRERGELWDCSQRLHDDCQKRIAFRTVYSAFV